MKYSVLVVICICFFSSCQYKSASVKQVQATDSLQLTYAKGFAVKYYPHYKEVIVYSPWVKGTVYAHYYLVADSSTVTPAQGIKVKVPLRNIAVTSVTHLEFLSLLQELETINAVCSPTLIYNSRVRERVGEGKIADLGDAFNINVEKTLQLQPSAVMMSGYNQHDPYAERVSKAAIPALFNNEWMETSLLGRAEWIKFVAAFYNKEVQADSLFRTIEKRYVDIRNRAKLLKSKPTIMAGSSFRGTWYMPAGKSFMGRLFADAGATYFYQNDTTSGSLPLNVETALTNFANTQVWLNCNFNTIDELLKADAKHAFFNPVKQRQVYNFNKRLLPSTANDFWESAVARPDLLLSDVIAILHPDLLPGYQLTYANQLK